MAREEGEDTAAEGGRKVNGNRRGAGRKNPNGKNTKRLSIKCEEVRMEA